MYKKAKLLLLIMLICSLYYNHAAFLRDSSKNSEQKITFPSNRIDFLVSMSGCKMCCNYLVSPLMKLFRRDISSKSFVTESCATVGAWPIILISQFSFSRSP